MFDDSFSPTPALAPVLLLIASLAIVLGTLLAMTTAAVGGWFVVQSITRPVRTLLAGTEKIGQGNLSHRVNLASQDEIGELARYRAVFFGVDTINGTCKVQVNDDERILRGKITDPALPNPGNVYTHSLDTKEPVMILAKPVLKDGEIVRLFISDGSFITDAAA